MFHCCLFAKEMCLPACRTFSTIRNFAPVIASAYSSSSFSSNNLLRLRGGDVLRSHRSYASVGSKVLAEKEDKSYIESDVEKLCKYVCINYYVQGEEPGPKILPDSEYPEWLFELDLRPPRPLEDLDPEVDGWLYWRELRRRQVQQAQRFAKLRTRFLHLQNSPSLRKSGGISRIPAPVEN
ncbi:39S ribosomal protein L54, mitochondrial [Toxocara canis]|uniref:Large ribosomal subunit protein mL54 n=1 Tax=Toxocara canis TaxID=6265 RepID=A0A0B2V1P5_TOXCA|nr:39S ribosomal protein L54, mitochondrial [Toxocara canis]